MNETTLVRSTPESVGISSRELLKMVQALEKSGTEMHGIMLCRHGKLILDGWWSPYTSKTIHICHSFGEILCGNSHRGRMHGRNFICRGSNCGPICEGN